MKNDLNQAMLGYMFEYAGKEVSASGTLGYLTRHNGSYVGIIDHDDYLNSPFIYEGRCDETIAKLQAAIDQDIKVKITGTVKTEIRKFNTFKGLYSIPRAYISMRSIDGDF